MIVYNDDDDDDDNYTTEMKHYFSTKFKFLKIQKRKIVPKNNLKRKKNKFFYSQISIKMKHNKDPNDFFLQHFHDSTSTLINYHGTIAGSLEPFASNTLPVQRNFHQFHPNLLAK